MKTQKGPQGFQQQFSIQTLDLQYYSDNNLMGGAKKFPVAMAEKRAMSRVVLKIAGFYEQGVFGQDEMVD